MSNALMNLSSISILDGNTTTELGELTTEYKNSLAPLPIKIEEFSTTKQANLFKSLKQNQFSGQLIVWDRRRVASIFYLFHGRIVFASGGYHPIRRFTRHLKLHCTELAGELSAFLENHQGTLVTKDFMSWQYQLLCDWVKKNKINREQVLHLIEGIVTEILFDLTQSQQVNYVLQSDKFISAPLILINSEEIIVEVWKLWLTWQQGSLADYSPNLAPVIRKPEQLQAHTLPIVYKILQESINNQTTLRDLAIEFKQNTLSLTRSLLMYVRWGLMELVEIEDFPGPIDSMPLGYSFSQTDHEKLVVYIDDNLAMCQRMRDLVTAAGYQYITIENQFEAIAICLEQNPDLIVINAQMSNKSGYQISHQLRKLPFFRHTPIIILVDHVSLIDKFRAKLNNISDIWPKFCSYEQMLASIFQFVPQKAAV